MSNFQEAKTNLFVECPKAFVKRVPNQDEEQGFFFQAEDGYGNFLGSGDTETNAWKSAIYNVIGVYFK